MSGAEKSGGGKGSSTTMGRRGSRSHWERKVGHFQLFLRTFDDGTGQPIADFATKVHMFIMFIKQDDQLRNAIDNDDKDDHHGSWQWTYPGKTGGRRKPWSKPYLSWLGRSTTTSGKKLWRIVSVLLLFGLVHSTSTWKWIIDAFLETSWHTVRTKLQRTLSSTGWNSRRFSFFSLLYQTN